MTSSTGLRERKKAKTRAAIQRHAWRLFQEQGYAATTVDQIAEAAEVSQSTFFRYFPTKEDVVLTDDYDPVMIEVLRAQPADLPPVRAIREAIRAVYAQITPEEWERERARHRLIMSVPELRARSLDQYVRAIELVAGAVAERAGLAPDDFAARVLAGAVIGASLAARSAMDGSFELSDFDRVDDALALLEAGLPLTPQ
jgi:AcrR family transcriptional regulator